MLPAPLPTAIDRLDYCLVLVSKELENFVMVAGLPVWLAQVECGLSCRL